MERIRASVTRFFTVLGIVLGLVLPGAPAQATSDYDGLLRAASSLFVYTDGGAKTQKRDISQSWFSSLSETYNLRVEQNIGWPTNFLSELEDIMESGSLGIAMRETPDGNFVEVFGSRDPDAYCGFTGSATTGIYSCTSHPGYGFVRASYFTHSSYGNSGCVGSYGNRCSSDGMNIYSAPTVQTGTAGYTIFDMANWVLPDYSFYVMDFDLTYPAGYAGEMLPSAPPAPKYVAMGDSYSSGQGNAPYESGTDRSSNACHRSVDAYPRRLQAALGFTGVRFVGFTGVRFVACSGAVSDYIIDDYNQEYVEPPQAAFLSEETELVTITIGGNDIGFGDVMATCTVATSQPGTTQEKHEIEHDDCLDAIEDARDLATGSALQNKLEDVFSGIRGLGGDDLEVIVAGYPNLFPSFEDISGSCVWGNGFFGTSGRMAASDELAATRSLHDELNAAIAAAVAATGDGHIRFVDPTSVFAGHELCRPAPWFHNVIPDAVDEANRAESYHPNSAGEAAYAGVVGGEAIDALS